MFSFSVSWMLRIPCGDGESSSFRKCSCGFTFFIGPGTLASAIRTGGVETNVRRETQCFGNGHELVIT